MDIGMDMDRHGHEQGHGYGHGHTHGHGHDMGRECPICAVSVQNDLLECCAKCYSCVRNVADNILNVEAASCHPGMSPKAR
jgi:hypothetical protein